MPENELDEELVAVIKKLQDKYNKVGEDLTAHLEGMLYSYYLNYWDYIGVDALLNLQKPKTKYPDEMIFIIYHQITELHFKLIIHELEQIGYAEDLTKELFISKLKRINRFWGHLTQSFNVIMSQMDDEQFLSFRKALIPSSGFQSIQYRLIELWATDLCNLVGPKYKGHFDHESDVKEMAEVLYWKRGATDLETGKKTLTLVQFEEKYGNLIIRKGNEFKTRNIRRSYYKLSVEDRNDPELLSELKEFDKLANINWRLVHYRYAYKYLQQGDRVVDSTGGTNWKKYLPPRFQKQMFYPELYGENETENWGKEWVENNILSV